jgi:hypothetical protein
MAEVVGAVAALAQLADCFLKLSEKLYRAIRRMRDVPQQIHDLWKDACILRTCLRTLSNASAKAFRKATDSVKERRNFEIAMDHIRDQGQRIYGATCKLLKTLVLNPKGSMLQKWTLKLKWLLRNEKTQFLQDMFAKVKQDIVLLNTTTTLKLLLAKIQRLEANGERISQELQDEM